MLVFLHPLLEDKERQMISNNIFKDLDIEMRSCPDKRNQVLIEACKALQEIAKAAQEDKRTLIGLQINGG